MNKKIPLIGAGIAMCVLGTASPYNLGSLISSNGSISIGDKLFADFGFSSTQFDPNDGTVSVALEPNGTYRVTVQGPWVSVLNPSGSSLVLQYTVEATQPNSRISEIGQAYVLSAAGTGGTISVDEKVRQGSFAGSVAAQSLLSYASGTPSTLDLEDPVAEPVQGDQLFVTPLLSKVYVTTTIQMNSEPRGMVGATTFVQTFRQVSVPEGGATLGLFGAGLIGVGAIRRRRTQS